MHENIWPTDRISYISLLIISIRTTAPILKKSAYNVEDISKLCAGLKEKAYLYYTLTQT